ncbi:DUF3667 domain-containing protein [Nostoc ellipsosporum NOK]|nr:DUF3667 domain-containing protein [Nostoc ellipsosporum NOK]
MADIFHFEGKFFKTTGLLIRKPGFLTAEYMRGRRMRYLHPVRMYLLTSAVFFLIYFTFFAGHGSFINIGSGKLETTDRLELAEGYRQLYQADTSRADLKENIALLEDTSRVITSEELRNAIVKLRNEGMSYGIKKYKTVANYDSIQASLPRSKRDNWLERVFNRKFISLNEKYGDDPEVLTEKISSEVLHRVPYMLFVSLPLFMLILKLVYIRRKQFTLVDHGIFTLHFYIFCFVLLFFVELVSSFRHITGWDFLGYITLVLYLSAIFYLLKAMRNFYGQSWIKTTGKFILVFIMAAIVAVLLLAIFLSYSTLTVK